MCFRMFEVFALTRELNLICCQWQAKKFGYGMIMHLPKQSAQMQSKGHMNSCRLSAFENEVGGTCFCVKEDIF